MPLTGKGCGGREGLGDGFGLEPAGLIGQPAAEPLLMMGKGRPGSKTQTLESRDVIRVNNRPVADTFHQTGYCREPEQDKETPKFCSLGLFKIYYHSALSLKIVFGEDE